MSSFNELTSKVASAVDDVAKATEGNASAIRRVRKTMQEVKKLASAIRTEMQTIANEKKAAKTAK